MQSIVQGAALIALLVFPMTSFAFGLRAGARASMAYYFPIGVSYGPVFQVVPADPCAVLVPQFPALPPAPLGRLYAPPSPAPASTTGPAGEPPLVPMSPAAPAPASETPPRSTINPGPSISESRSFYDAYTAASSTSPTLAAGRARVGFWNLTEREVTLKVDNRTYLLPRGKSLKLDLARQFVWKVSDHKPQREQVPEPVPALEIVIRR